MIFYKRISLATILAKIHKKTLKILQQIIDLANKDIILVNSIAINILKTLKKIASFMNRKLI